MNTGEMKRGGSGGQGGSEGRGGGEAVDQSQDAALLGLRPVDPGRPSRGSLSSISVLNYPAHCFLSALTEPAVSETRDTGSLWRSLQKMMEIILTLCYPAPGG